MRFVAIVILFFISTQALCQYYLRGEVRDEKGKNLANVRIYLKSKGAYPYSSGSSGMFGIPSSFLNDTITLILDGYEVLKEGVRTDRYQIYTLKMLPATANLNRLRLASKTKDLTNERSISVFSLGESYNPIIENSFIEAKSYPETGFALNVDRASYSNIRRMLNMDYTVPKDAVRIEEILNYFSFDSVAIPPDKHFGFASNIASCPWNKNNHLLLLKLQAPQVDLSNVPPTNFTFLIDVSGSMDKENRLPLVKSAFKLLVKHLRPQDSVSIVVYGGIVGVMLPPTSGSAKDKIIQAIEQLNAAGDTPGEAAIKIAYRLASRSFNKNGNNRIILATDGDFNVGQTTEEELEDLIVHYKQTGIYLTCLGVGMGNYKDSKLQVLAKKGNGNFAYLDQLREAEKVLVTEFTKTVYSVANDAYLNVKFNADYVQSYRLIGFDNKADAIRDTSSILEGGEIGSGQTVVALFEIATNENATCKNLATVKLNYKKAGQLENNFSEEWTVANTSVPFDSAGRELKLATAISMFGSLLKQSDYAKKYNWDDVVYLIDKIASPDDVLLQELRALCVKAKLVYNNGRKKKEKPILFTEAKQ